MKSLAIHIQTWLLHKQLLFSIALLSVSLGKIYEVTSYTHTDIVTSQVAVIFHGTFRNESKTVMLAIFNNYNYFKLLVHYK